MPLLIALDIDGTTVHHDGSLSPVVRDAVARVRDAGHHIVLATGRSLIGTVPVATELGLGAAYAVCSNGAVTITLDGHGGYDVVESVTFDPSRALAVLEGQWADGVVASEQLGVGYLVSAPFPEGELLGEQRVVSWEELLHTRTTRVTFRSPTGTSEDFVALADRLGLHEVNYAIGFTAWLDINPEGVSKASALEQVRRTLGVEPMDTVAVGDHHNDVQMLAWAARGVAMGQAPDDVLAVADEVTGTVEDDGLATVLLSLL